MKTYVLSKLEADHISFIFVGNKHETLHYMCHQNPAILTILQGVEKLSQDEWFNELKTEFSEQADADYSSQTVEINGVVNVLTIDNELDRVQLITENNNKATIYMLEPEQTN